MYSYDCFLNGITYTVFIFSTFTGHSHPYTPSKPISIDEAYSQSRETFYLAWYADGESGRKLYFFEKYWIRFEDVPVFNEVKSKVGRYYYAVDNAANSTNIDKNINEKETVSAEIFYLYVGDASGRAIVSTLVRKGLMDKYTYTYKKNGILEKTETEVLDIPE